VSIVWNVITCAAEKLYSVLQRKSVEIIFINCLQTINDKVKSKSKAIPVTGRGGLWVVRC
jgi:hypothetical protein